MTLDNLLVRGRNNLDFMRLVAAVAVIVSHAFPLSQGAEYERTHEPLMRLTGGQATLGGVAVSVFFIISGFLITASYERTGSPWRFLAARARRIFPALLVVVALSALLLGPVVSSLSPREYFSSPEVGRYFSAIALVNVNLPLPGVFEGNAYSSLVNGSIWTLFYEFACYLLVLALGALRALRRDVMLGLLTVALAVHLMFTSGAWLWFPQVTIWREVWTSSYLLTMAQMGAYFLVGGVAYMYRRHVKLTWWGCGMALALVIGAYLYGRGMLEARAIAGTYAVLYLGSLPSRLNAWGGWGDFSYGTYVYAWPVQQTLVFAHGGAMAAWLNIALAVPITLVLGAASWHLVEKRALRRPPVSQRVERSFASGVPPVARAAERSASIEH